MRPVLLTLEGFGPFLSEEILDLEKLSGRGLFLIQGAVGSGKTFLLDAICFALYGISSGGDRTLSELRTLSFPPEKWTSVRFDFTVAEKTYRIERLLRPDPADPEQLTQTCTLWFHPRYRQPNSQDVLSSSVQGAAKMIQKLLGLDAKQFRQLVIVPQGKFGELLFAAPEQRRETLSVLAGLGRYLEFSEGLRDRTEGAQLELDLLNQELDRFLLEYDSAHGDPQAELERTKAELQAVGDELDELRQRSGSWHSHLESVVRYETLARQRDHAQRELEVLEGTGQEEERSLRSRLLEALPHYQEWRHTFEEISELNSELQRHEADYQRLTQETDFVEAEIARARELEEEKFQLRWNLERLQELHAQGEGLEVLAQEWATAVSRLEDLKERWLELKKRFKKLKGQQSDFRLKLQELEHCEQELKDLGPKVERLEAGHLQVQQRQQLLELLDQTRSRRVRFLETIAELELEFQRAQSELRSAQGLQEAQWRARLSQELEPGQPCPICGATDHQRTGADGQRPEYESSTSQEPEAGVLETLERRLLHARQECQQLDQRSARLEGRLEQLEGEDTLPEVVNEHLAEQKERLATLRKQHARLEKVRDSLESVTQQILPLQRDLKKIRISRERLTTLCLTAEEAYQFQEKRFLNQLAHQLNFDPESESTWKRTWSEKLYQERARTELRLTELEEIAYSSQRAILMGEAFASQLLDRRVAQQRLSDLESRNIEIQNDLWRRFQGDFESWEGLQASLGRLERERNLSRNQVLDKEILVGTVKRQLSQSQELLNALPSPDFSSMELRNKLSSDRERLEALTARRSVLEGLLTKQSWDVERYVQLEAEIRAVRGTVSKLAPLAQAASGEAGQSFSDWIIGKFLGRVLKAANVRLQDLAPGNFYLTPGPSLEILAFDLKASQVRALTTLSGGEAFLATVALALGLGDVLQGEHNGQSRVQTLILDEGFGSLDKASCQAAVEGLRRLAGLGFTVGIVSHLETLKEQVQQKITITAHSSLPDQTSRRITLQA